MKGKIISQILMENGWVYSRDGVITEFEKNGEMASVTWYRKTYEDGTCSEYNGKYVMQVNYENL